MQREQIQTATLIHPVGRRTYFPLRKKKHTQMHTHTQACQHRIKAISAILPRPRRTSTVRKLIMVREAIGSFCLMMAEYTPWPPVCRHSAVWVGYFLFFFSYPLCPFALLACPSQCRSRNVALFLCVGCVCIPHGMVTIRKLPRPRMWL